MSGPIPVLVPRRPDLGRRDAIWSHLQSVYWANLPHPVVVGTHTEGPFNRSRALNQAAADAGDWDIAIIADADVQVPVDQLVQAVETCSRTGQTTIAFTQWRNVTEDVTAAMLAGTHSGPLVSDFVRDELGVSGMTVVARETWDRVGGFDEGFVGYGWEDKAFDAVCRTVGPVERVTGPCWHLNHPRPVAGATFAASRARYEAIRRRCRAESMRRI